jgi:membrane protein
VIREDVQARAVHEARAMLRRLLDLEIVDRSLAVGGMAFSALIPLLIVIAGWGTRDGSSLADSLVNRFDLTGAAADAVRNAFAAPQNGDTTTIFGSILVIASVLSFTRAVQRVYERTWNLPALGYRSTKYGLMWVVLFGTYWALFPVVTDAFHRNGVAWLVSLAGTFGFWLATPYLMLGRRVAWQRLILQGALTAVGMTIVVAGSALYAKRALRASAEEYGSIGVAFTLLSILWAAGFVLVGSAALGSYPYVGRRPGSDGS